MFRIDIAPAKEFTVIQISDEKMYNREPVIGETGLAAWSAYVNNDKGEVGSEIYVYTNGTPSSITQGQVGAPKSNIKPEIQSNIVVWSGTFQGLGDSDVDWVLREVPEDNSPVKELDATYNIRIDKDGKQVFEKSSSVSSSENTNGLTAEASGSTNAPAASTNEIPAPQDTSRRTPSGDAEICRWDSDLAIEFKRLSHDARNDLAPSVWGQLVSWQKAKGWPFGWEIMIWNDGVQQQLTTNYYYDMAPKVHKDRVVWYGWDGHDFEIYLYDTLGGVSQITSNQYDDVSPVIWGDTLAWEGYAGVDADVFIWKEGKIQKVSDNIEDDLNPRVWNGQVVWQGFDGDDFEIYLYDGVKTIKLTSNTYDDVNPHIQDDLICWMGYFDNWDSEIFVWDGGPQAIRLTDNEFEERDPRTGKGMVVWQSDQQGKSLIYLASPKN
ncbi:MAG TPA: hypothetical protein DCZ95_20155 [Verrucomicrobia bacterium]|nr:hypothetical protein [Verrucomicrobiota bacterium]